MKKTYLATLLFLGLLLLYLDFAVGRRETGSPAGGRVYKVMILGLDGADPDFLGALMGQGKLPNLQRLLREGAYGPCRTFKPTKSNVIWTSIATGKRMEKHGIVDWMVLSEDGRQKLLATGNTRRVEALWNIASTAGRSVEIINWWATWPAEPVRGEMVSNHFSKSLSRPIEESTYPPALYDELQPLTTMDARTIEAEMRAAGIPVYTPEAAESAFRPSDNFRQRFRDAARLFAEDKLVERVAFHLLESRAQRDLLAVIFRSVDVFSHFSWRFIERRTAERVHRLLNEAGGPLTADLEKEMDEAYAAVLEPVYSYEDRRLGRFMERAEPNTVIVVVSDHGFQFRNYGFYHYDGPLAPSGVVFLWGPPIRPGVRLAGEVSVFDICPTVLYLMGIPVGRDMDGRVLTEAIDPKVLAARPVGWLPTHETGRRGGKPRPSPVDEQILEELRTLGYVQ